MTNEDKILAAEIKELQKNGDKVYSKQLAEREALLNDPENVGLVRKVKLGMLVAQAAYKARTSAKLTQKELAKKLHTRQSYIAEVEKGKRNITIDTLERYATACGKHVELKLV